MRFYWLIRLCIQRFWAKWLYRGWCKVHIEQRFEVVQFVGHFTLSSPRNNSVKVPETIPCHVFLKASISVAHRRNMSQPKAPNILGLNRTKTCFKAKNLSRFGEFYLYRGHETHKKTATSLTLRTNFEGYMNQQLLNQKWSIFTSIAREIHLLCSWRQIEDHGEI